jgi:RNA polymerase sigma-70 factor (ECF subfamily)
LAYFRTREREQPVDPELLLRLAEAAERVEQARPAPAQQAALMACLEALPQHSRRLIRMRYDQDSSGAAHMAGRLGRSVQAIYAQVKRIKQALRACVERRLAREQET